jgi:hypothetical protein
MSANFKHYPNLDDWKYVCHVEFRLEYETSPNFSDPVTGNDDAFYSRLPDDVACGNTLEEMLAEESLQVGYVSSDCFLNDKTNQYEEVFFKTLYIQIYQRVGDNESFPEYTAQAVVRRCFGEQRTIPMIFETDQEDRQ